MTTYEILCERITHEQNQYRDWLLGMKPEKILDHAYEYSVREDIVCLITNTEYSEDECKTLLELPDILNEIYNEWDKFNGFSGQMDCLASCVDSLVYKGWRN